MKKAVIATEDKSFYKHKGFDSFGLLRSVFVNVKSGRLVQGAVLSRPAGEWALLLPPAAQFLRASPVGGA